MDLTKHQQNVNDWEQEIKKHSEVCINDSSARFKRVYECVTDIQMLSKLKTEIKEYEEAFYQQTRRIDNKLIELIDLCNKGKNLLQQVIVNNLKMYNNGEFSELITKTIKRHSDEDVELIFVLPDFFYSKDCQQYIKDFKYDERITYIKESEYEDFMFHRNKDKTLIRIFNDSTDIEKLDKIYNVKVSI